jgi:hypothetical protein
MNPDQLKILSQRILSFFNLTDRDGNLSISNIAVIVCVTKMAIAPEVTLVDAGALLVALLNYSHKRQQASQFQHKQEDTSTIDELKSQIKEIKATADESLDKASKLALAATFKR